jgi:hypothetical protein
MPTIMTQSDDAHIIYNTYKEKFLEGSPISFFNLLWQTIVNRVHHDKVFIFHPVETIDDTPRFTEEIGSWQIAKVFLNEDGYMPMGVEMAPGLSYRDACQVCDEINEKLFGILPALGEQIVKSSMPDTPIQVN